MNSAFNESCLNFSIYQFDFDYFNTSLTSPDIVMGDSNGEARISIYSKNFNQVGIYFLILQIFTIESAKIGSLSFSITFEDQLLPYIPRYEGYLGIRRGEHEWEVLLRAN